MLPYVPMISKVLTREIGKYFLSWCGQRCSIF